MRVLSEEGKAAKGGNVATKRKDQGTYASHLESAGAGERKSPKNE